MSPILVQRPTDSEGRDFVSSMEFERTKVRLHEQLVDSCDLSMVVEADERVYLDEVQRAAEELLNDQPDEIIASQRESMLKGLMSEVFGLGPLDALLDDSEISDILVNGPHEVYIERNGCLEPTNICFADHDHLVRIIQRVVARVGRRIDEQSPLVDARLEDGSRVNAVLPPLAIHGATLCIRRFGRKRLTLSDLVKAYELTDDIATFLHQAVAARVGLMISGGSGAGKSTLLNALAEYIPSDERLLTIEDTAELNLPHRHVVSLETRPPNMEGFGEVNQRLLVKNSLRMRPDRIIIGEVRGGEALDMLQAMNTGHEGSMTTIHANDATDALARLETMVTTSGTSLSPEVIREYISSGIGLIVHVARLKGGTRRITRVAEIIGVENGRIQTADIFGFEQKGVTSEGKATGHFFTSGYTPRCLAKCSAAGVDIDPAIFQKKVMVAL